MKVLGGSVIIEPGLQERDFAELAEQGVRLAKVGFGSFGSQVEAAPLVRGAGCRLRGHEPHRRRVDTGLLAGDGRGRARARLRHHRSRERRHHGALDADLPALFDAPGAIQLVQAGNLRSSLRILGLPSNALSRVVLATDTPTGTGVMPLGMIKTVVEVSAGSPAGRRRDRAGHSNNAAVLRRDEGVLDAGRPADLALVQAPLGAADDALGAIEIGDIPGISAVVIDGELRCLRSRNTRRRPVGRRWSWSGFLA
ncbi:MAG: hypothetical protein U0807_19215 [Candidatus Binatia bacterium]